jgi:hypothetical protein
VPIETVASLVVAAVLGACVVIFFLMRDSSPSPARKICSALARCPRSGEWALVNFTALSPGRASLRLIEHCSLWHGARPRCAGECLRAHPAAAVPGGWP